MRSLKLSGLIRRNPDRPSLKQRAVALKATAAKVIRRPAVPADADPFEGRPVPAGFVAYPFDAPAGWLNIRYALKAEGERLLLLALRELDRRVDAYRGSRFNEDEVRSHETRLRRELRIDALMALSGRMDPSDKPLPEPGSEAAMAAFHAACGEATRLMHSPLNGYPELRHPKAGWWTKYCLSRALEDGTITVAEFARLHPLAAEREHRDEAALLASNIGVLHALAYANEYPQAANVADEAAGGNPALIALGREFEAHRQREAELQRIAGDIEGRADERLPQRPGDDEGAEAWSRWQAECSRINAEEGATAADAAAAQASHETVVVADRIATTAATTAEGLRIKVRALAHCDGAPNTKYPGGRLIASLMRDAQAEG